MQLDVKPCMRRNERKQLLTVLTVLETVRVKVGKVQKDGMSEK